jgi:hypothetical protein
MTPERLKEVELMLRRMRDEGPAFGNQLTAAGLGLELVQAVQREKELTQSSRDKCMLFGEWFRQARGMNIEAERLMIQGEGFVSQYEADRDSPSLKRARAWLTMSKEWVNRFHGQT